MLPENLKLELESLQKQINEHLDSFSQSLKKDLPFHVLKDIHVKIKELKTAMEQLKSELPVGNDN